MPNKQSTGLWILTGLLALTFVLTGAGKLASIPPSPENFARWGLSSGFMYSIGAVEVIGGAALCVRRVAPFAALGLMVTMLGAVKTGVAFGEALHIALPTVLLCLLGVLVFLRRAELLSLLRRGA